MLIEKRDAAADPDQVAFYDSMLCALEERVTRAGPKKWFGLQSVAFHRPRH